MNEPICILETQEELENLTREWQHRLFLDHWFISVRFHEPDEFPDEAGHNSFCHESMFCEISVVRPKKEDLDKYIVKFCHELTLVHELLHLCINWLNPPDSCEGMYMDTLEHRLVHKLAMAMVCAKYGIDRSWFKGKDTI